MADARRVYWDTSVFLCFLNQQETERRAICEDILRHARDGKIELYTSTFTIAEVVRPKAKSLPGAKRLTPEQIAKIQGMFEWRWLRKIELDQRVAFRAVELARDRGLWPADAVHAASAIVWKLDALQRWDRDFENIADLITVEYPIRLSDQSEFEGAGFRRIGPHPDDFEEPPSGGESK